MRLVVDMLWGKDLTVNHSHFGAKGGYRRKPHVQEWAEALAASIIVERVVAIAEGRDVPHINLPVRISVDFRFPDERRRDPHNYHKIIADAVAAGLRINDENIRISTGNVERGVGKADAGFMIEVSDEVEDETPAN